MYFLLVCGRAPTLSNAIRPYPTPWKNCKTWKNAFFAGFREGPNAIQRYPSLSQTLEKLQNLEKCIFCWFAGEPKLGKIAKTWKNAALREGPTLSNTIRPYPKPWKIAKPEKCIFCWFPGRPQRYPTLSVLIPDPRKIAKPGKMFFAGLRGWQNLEKLQNLEKVFFASLREGPNAIQRYPSLSQTLKKLQNLEKCIFCWFPGRVQRYPTLSVLISDPRKNPKPGKKHFLLFCGRSQNLEKLQNLEKCFFFSFREGFNTIQRYPSLS